MKDSAFLRPDRNNGYGIEYIHGHDTFQSPHPHIFNLDTPCGKASHSKQRERVQQFQTTLAKAQLSAQTEQMLREYLETVNLLKVLEERPCR